MLTMWIQLQSISHVDEVLEYRGLNGIRLTYFDHTHRWLLLYCQCLSTNLYIEIPSNYSSTYSLSSTQRGHELHGNLIWALMVLENRAYSAGVRDYCWQGHFLVIRGWFGCNFESAFGLVG